MKHNKVVLSKLAKKQIENIGGKTLVFNKPMVIKDTLIHASLFTLPNGAEFLVIPYYEDGWFGEEGYFKDDEFLAVDIYKNEPYEMDSHFKEVRVVEDYSYEYQCCLDKKYFKDYKDE